MNPNIVLAAPTSNTNSHSIYSTIEQLGSRSGTVICLVWWIAVLPNTPEIRGQAVPFIRLASASRNPSKPNKSAMLEREPSCSIGLQLAVKRQATRPPLGLGIVASARNFITIESESACLGWVYGSFLFVPLAARLRRTSWKVACKHASLAIQLIFDPTIQFLYTLHLTVQKWQTTDVEECHNWGVRRKLYNMVADNNETAHRNDSSFFFISFCSSAYLHCIGKSLSTYLFLILRNSSRPVKQDCCPRAGPSGLYLQLQQKRQSDILCT